MKIAIDGSTLNSQKTGLGQYVFPILVELIQQRPSDEFIIYGHHDMDFPKLPRVTFKTCPFKIKSPLFQNIYIQFQLIKDKPNVFWATTGFIPLLAPLFTKTIITIFDHVYLYEPDTMSYFGYYARKWFQPLSARLSQKIVTISQSTANELYKNYHRKADAVARPVIDPIYFSKEISSECMQKYSLEKGYFLCIGTLEPRKNIVTLVKSYLMASAQYDLPALVIAGTKGWKDNEITKLKNDLDKNKKIQFLGFVPQNLMPCLYKNACIFFFPSLYEGFGMPVLESLIMETPVVTSHHPSLHEASQNQAIHIEPTIGNLYEIFKKYSDNSLVINKKPTLQLMSIQETASIYNQLIDELA